MRYFAWMVLLLLAGCASHAPAPVADGKPVRVETTRGGKAADEKLYTVKKGDTLQGIALAHDVDHRDLAAWNNIDNPNRIQVGQQLRLAAPRAGGTQPAAPVVAGTEVRAIAQGGGIEARSLDGSPTATPLPAAGTTATPARSVPSASTFADDGDTLKHAPKGGKQLYSEQLLAQMKTKETATQAAAAPVPAPAADKPAPAAAAAVPATPATEGEVDWGWPASGKVIGSFNESATSEINKGIDIGGKMGDQVLAAAAGKTIYAGQMAKYGNIVVILHSGGYSSVYAHNSKLLVQEGQVVTRGQKIAELGNTDTDQPKLHFEIRAKGKPQDPVKFLPGR